MVDDPPFDPGLIPEVPARKIAPLPALLLVAVALVVAGVGTWSVGAALVVAGLLLAGWAWLFFGDIPDQPKDAVPE